MSADHNRLDALRRLAMARHPGRYGLAIPRAALRNSAKSAAITCC